MSLRRPALALISLLLVSPLAWSATVYKWTNDDGVVQYTDAEPEGRKFERLEIGGSVSRTDSSTAGTDTGGGSTDDADGSTEGAEGEAEKPDPLKAACDVAKRNVETFEGFETVSMDRDGDGKAETLSPEDRAAELARNQDLAKRYCRD